MEALIAVAARVLLSLLFVVSGIRQAMFRDKVMAEMARHGIPAPGPALALAITLELIAGTALLLGIRTDWAAIALILFTAASTLFYYRDLRDRESLLHALKNAAIVGGLMLAAVHGQGPSVS